MRSSKLNQWLKELKHATARAACRSFASGLIFLTPLVSGQVVSPSGFGDSEFAELFHDEPPRLNWNATGRDAISTTWEATEYITNEITGQVTAQPHRYIEIGSGLNYLNLVTGQYVRSRDLIELTADGGAAALQGPAKLYLKAILNSEAAITIVTPSGHVFNIRPLGIFWFDAQSGQAELVTPVQDCVGELVPPNQVVWKSAFGPIADLRITYTKSGIDSELIFL